MKVLGVTGGPGMGKSTAAQLLHGMGVVVVDTDDLARRVVEPGERAFEEVRAAFGQGVITPDGRLNRDELGRRVFADAGARKRLEDILHPRIRELWAEQVALWRAEKFSMAAVVIPLLFETHAETEFDAVVCLACSAATQRRRLAAREWPAEQVRQRIEAQWPIERKIAASDFVAWTEGPFEVLSEQLKRVLASLRTRSQVWPT
jgi:dephospho-CoA kinase